VRILLVSDLHYQLRQFDWLTLAASDETINAQAVVIAGDLLDIRSAVPLDAQAVAVTAQLRDIGRRIEVMAASGNHDLDGRDEQGEKTSRWLTRASAPGVYVDGQSVLLDDTLFTVCPWWDGPLGRASLDAVLRADSLRPKRRWVWIYHAPPVGSPLAWDGRREFGDEALAEWLPVFRPDVVLTGHIHQAPFVPGGDWIQQIGSTWLFNPGQQPGPVPSYIVLDLTSGFAEWTSATQRRSATAEFSAAT
jgi:Icc-related predicted phosphoesterase